MVRRKANGHSLAKQAGNGRGGRDVEAFKRALVDNLY